MMLGNAASFCVDVAVADEEADAVAEADEEAVAVAETLAEGLAVGVSVGCAATPN
jgi:hypothetical protein